MRALALPPAQAAPPHFRSCRRPKHACLPQPHATHSPHAHRAVPRRPGPCPASEHDDSRAGLFPTPRTTSLAYLAVVSALYSILVAHTLAPRRRRRAQRRHQRGPLSLPPGAFAVNTHRLHSAAALIATSVLTRAHADASPRCTGGRARHRPAPLCTGPHRPCCTSCCVKLPQCGIYAQCGERVGNASPPKLVGRSTSTTTPLTGLQAKSPSLRYHSRTNSAIVTGEPCLRDG